MNGTLTAAGGVADVVGTVVELLGAAEVVVVEAAVVEVLVVGTSMLVEEAAPATGTGVVTRMSPSSDVRPMSTGAPHW
ncbi:MAG: hypothetical protein ACLQRH_16590 [Acidimicrobiales bacterium]